MPRIIIDENIPLLKEALHPSAETFTAAGRAIDNKMLKELSADAVVVRSVTKLDEQLLSGTNVRFAGTSTSGYDNVDINYLKEAGIEFANAPGSNANSVAEYVVWSILSKSDRSHVVL